MALLTYNNVWLTFGDKVLEPVDYNPLGLPPYTMRFLFDKPDYSPIPGRQDPAFVGTWTQVSSSPNIWDFTYENSNWGRGTYMQYIDVFEYQKGMSWWLLYSPSANRLVADADYYYTDRVPWVHLLGANTAGITNMSYLFGPVENGGSTLKGFTEICLFDTSSVTDLQRAFYGLVNVSSLPSYDTHNASSLKYAFAVLPNTHNAVAFDLSSCTDASYLLYNTGFTSVTLSGTSHVTDFSYAFYMCDDLVTVSQFDTSSASNMKGLFSGCSSLTSVPQLDTSLVTDASSMFRDCSSLTSIPLFDTSAATNVEGLFVRCSSLTSIPLIDTSSAVNMSYMCYHCTSLTEVPLLNTSVANNVGGMFEGCVNVQDGALDLYNQLSSQSVQPQYYTDCFKDCGSSTASGQADLAQIPTSWGGTQV